MRTLGQAVTDRAASESSQAWAEAGHSVFVFALSTSYSGSPHALSSVALAIEAIEANGWSLDSTTVYGTKTGHVVLTFRRAS